MTYGSYFLDLCKPQKNPKLFSQINAKLSALLMMKRCMSYCVLFFPLKKACNKCHTSQITFQRAFKPV